MDNGALERIMAGLVRVGTVTDRDERKCRVRVKFQSENMTSGWLYVLQRQGGDVKVASNGLHGHPGSTDSRGGGVSVSSSGSHGHPLSVTGVWMPKVNESVLCLYLPVFNADGFVLGGIL